jgi:hypothetical protein
MSDDLMDARLRAAGERWRAAHDTPAAEPSADGEHPDIAVGPTLSHRRRWTLVGSAAVVAAALAVGGVFMARTVGGSRPDTAADARIDRVTGVTWTMAGGPTLTFTSGHTVRVSNTCDSSLHRVRISRTRMTVGTQIGKASVCSPPFGGPGPAADRFDRVVRGTVAWSLSSDTLTLTKRHVGTITLGRNGAPPPALVGTHWFLASVVDRKGVTDGVAGRLALTVDPHGLLVADDGTNAINADTTVRSRSITLRNVRVGTVGATSRDPVSSVVDHVLSGGAVRYEIRGTDLILRGRAPERLIYHARPPAAIASASLYRSWRLLRVTNYRETGPSRKTPSVIFSLDRSGTARTSEGDVSRFTISGSRMTFRQPWVNDLLGPPGPQRSLRKSRFVYRHVLTKTVRWSIDGNQLTLARPGVGSLAFLALGGQRDDAVLHRTWLLDTIRRGNSTEIPDWISDAAIPRLTFDAHGRFAGREGCVRLGGKVVETRGTISFQGVTHDTTDCASKSPSTYLDAILGRDVRWSVRGRDELVLSTSGTALTFRAG